MINYSIENGNVYRITENETAHIGIDNTVNTVRIDDNTVEDVSYTFDLEKGEYVEQSRIKRSEPLPTAPETPEQKIARLEEGLSAAQDAIMALMDMGMM